MYVVVVVPVIPVDDILVAPFPKLLQGENDSSASSAHSSRIVLKGPIDDYAADLVFFHNIGESFEAISINGTNNVFVFARIMMKFVIVIVIIVIVIVESQGFQFVTRYPKGWMRRDGNAHPVLVKVYCEDRVVVSLFPVQDRCDLGRFAQFTH